MFGVKFRPLDFDSVLGLDNVKDILRASLKKDKISSGYIFSGDYSTGKTTLSRIFSRSLLCKSRKEDMSPCNSCSSCKSFLSGRHPGYLEIDAANNAGKDQIKDIKKMISYESVSDYIIIHFDESQNISKEGNDALLEQLESNSENVVFIFSTTEVEKMRPALRSRCTEFSVTRPSNKAIQEKLEKICEAENIVFDPYALQTIVQASEQHYRTAENTLETVSLLGDVSLENVKKYVTVNNELVRDILMALPHDLSEALKKCDLLVSEMNIKNVYENILRLINDAIKVGRGYRFENASYNSLVKDVHKQFGDSLFEILDYILSKNKLTDALMLQSDLIVIHYKMLRSQFDSSPKYQAQNRPQTKDTDQKTSNNEKGTAAAINELPPWKKENEIRKIKAQKNSEKKDNTVEEKISKKWKTSKEESIPEGNLRKEITAAEFKKVLGGVLDEERI